MKLRNIFLFICTLLLINTVKAQDPHFSQFFSSPLTLNPAFTGKFDGIFRLAANHRDQWPSIPKAYVTTSGSVDFGILKKALPENDILGIGFSGLSDQSADNALKLNFGSLSMSYHKALDEEGNNTFGAGIQATYSSLNLDVTKLRFEDQLTANGFTKPTTSEVLTNGSTQNYFDVNAGLLFSGSSTGENNYYFGASVYHINQPAVGFIDQLWLLQPRLTIHGGYSTPIDDKNGFHSSAIFQYQNQASEFVAGGAFSRRLNDVDNEKVSNLYLGAWYRLKDAVIPYVGLEFNNILLGFSYDVNVSSLKAATASKGGTEISLIYIQKKEEHGKGVPCPRF
ncbi:PorP/SprF family type IX secretion system membrane protein [Ferruginibacter sp. SUN002]|uniref:PorP/SprF family type IX secretion system membrane protein n=1 Tax=Ferruginibacter sp. SUN002 TaxID=2937789 RepID=UPI003D363EB9